MASPRTLAQVQLWNQFVGEGGVRLAVITGLIAGTLEEHYEHDGLIPVSTLRITAQYDYTWAQYLSARRVVRLVYTTEDFDEFRLTEHSQGRFGQATVSLVARGVLADLADRGSLLTVTSTSPVVSLSVSKTDTVSNLLAAGLAVGPTGWAIGTVTPTETLTVVAEQCLALDWIIAVVQEYVRRHGNGSAYRIRSRRNGTSGYYLDFQSVATVGEKYIVSRKNLVELVVASFDDEQRGDKVFPLGRDGGGVGPAYYQVSAISAGAYVELQGVGLMSGPPAVGEDEFNGLYLVPMRSAAAAVQVTDTTTPDAATTRCSVATTTEFAVGDWVRVATSSSKDHLVSVGVGNAKTIKASADLLTHTNWLLNPDLGNGTTDWVLGSAWSRVTTAGLYGGAALNYTAGGAGTGDASNTPRTAYLPATGTWIYSLWFRSTDGSGTFLFKVYDLTTNTLTAGATIPVTNTGGEWTRLDVPTTYDTLTATRSLGVTITASVAATANSFKVGAVQLAYGGTPLEFVAGSGAARLRTWAMRRAYAASGGAYTSIAAKALDLYRLDGTAYSQNELFLGEWAWFQTGGGVGGAPGSAALRSIEGITYDLLNPLNTTLVLDARRRGVTDVIA